MVFKILEKRIYVADDCNVGLNPLTIHHSQSCYQGG